jgi:heme/copper-type cytochrome/quinol oxidase subunit 2
MEWKELVVIILVVAIIAAIVALTLAGDNEAAKKTLHILILVLVILLIIYIVYEIYEYYRKIKRNEPLLFDGPTSGKMTQKFSAKMLPPSRIGAEYTYSFWIYVKNWDYNYDEAKHILSRGTDPAQPKFGETFVCNPGIWLYPKTSNLMIRFDTYGRESNYT